ncbi:MAG: helix-turn-helix domain-containing protein [Bacteroidales bacterium]
MKNFIEMFEFLSNCDSKTMLVEINEYAQYLLKQCKNDAEINFLTNIGKVIELNRLTEWYCTNRFNELLYGKEKSEDVIMTVEGAADYLKTTDTTVYALLKKGKIRKIEISTVDKPGARPIVRIRKSDIDNYLNGK